MIGLIIIAMLAFGLLCALGHNDDKSEKCKHVPSGLSTYEIRGGIFCEHNRCVSCRDEISRRISFKGHQVVPTGPWKLKVEEEW